MSMLCYKTNKWVFEIQWELYLSMFHTVEKTLADRRKKLIETEELH